MHDLWRMYNGHDYVLCDFSRSQMLVPHNSSSTHIGYIYDCDVPGTVLFACSVGTACTEQKQKVAVHVVNMASTKEVRSHHSSMLGEKIWSLTQILDAYKL